MSNHLPFATHVAVAELDREKLVRGLNTTLATALDLHSQVKQAHWNIKGPQFFARHELFERLATRVLTWADELAERTSALGGYAMGTTRLGAAASEISEYDLSAVDGSAHLLTLVERYATFCERLRVRVNEAADADDAATEDLYIEILRAAELDMWFLESHLVPSGTASVTSFAHAASTISNGAISNVGVVNGGGDRATRRRDQH